MPELGTSVLLIPGSRVKNGDVGLVVMNRVARLIVESLRATHPEFVFTFRGKPITRMLTSAWIRARERTGLATVRDFLTRRNVWSKGTGHDQSWSC